jgi:hypothetical protein
MNPAKAGGVTDNLNEFGVKSSLYKSGLNGRAAGAL